MNIAVIPARGGSKRIVRKNIRDFCGSPMLGWPISTALACGVFDRIIVTTDDAEVAALALALGAEVPFMRPDELATDTTATVPVIRHAITELAAKPNDLICCIYPTAAFMQVADLQQASKIVVSGNADFVMPVTAYSSPLSRALQLSVEGRLSMCMPEFVSSRTQDCTTFYHDVGHFYLGRAAAWQSELDFYQRQVKAVLIPKYRAHDIDTQEDWEYAEMLFSCLQKKIGSAGSCIND